MRNSRIVAAVLLAGLTAFPGGSAQAAGAITITPECRVLAAGRNDNGQLGDGTIVDRTSPVSFLLPTTESARDIAIASGASAPGVSVLTYSGKVYSAGLNNHGQLGDGTTVDRSTPVVFALPAGELAARVFPGGNTTYVLTVSGRVFGAGRNQKGQLGDGTTVSRPVPVAMNLPAGEVAVSVVPGLESAYIVSASGVLYAVGGNYFGQFGQGHQADSVTPVVFPLPPGSVVVDAVEGSDALFVLTSDGAVFGAGTNAFGQLGDGTTTNSPVPVRFGLPAGEIAAQIYPSSGTTFVRTVSGRVYGAGYNARGQLGDGTTATQATPVRFTLPAGQLVSSIHPGPDRLYALTRSGQVFGAGANETGQLGIGSVTDAPTPTRMLLPASETVVEADPTVDAAFVRTASGRVYSMGANGFGYLGDGTYSTRTSPVRWGLPATETAIEVSPALGYVFVTTASGTAYGAGWNLAGNLGDGTDVNQPSPVRRLAGLGTRVVSTRSILSKHSFSYGLTCRRTGTLAVTTTSTAGPVPDHWEVSVGSSNCQVPSATGSVPGAGGAIDFQTMPVFMPDGVTKCLYAVTVGAADGWTTGCLEPSYTLVDAGVTAAGVCNTAIVPPPTTAPPGPATTLLAGVLPSNPSIPAAVLLPETGSGPVGGASLVGLGFLGVGMLVVLGTRRRPAVVPAVVRVRQR